MEDGDTENYHVSSVIQNFVFLCRKVGSIKGYFCRYIINKGIRRPSVRRPSVCLSTFSNDISSEAVRPILFIFHI